MTKVIWINPIALLTLWYLSLIFAALFIVGGMAKWPSITGFILGYVGNVLVLILSISWPYGLYKCLSQQQENEASSDGNKFVMLLFVSCILPPALLGIADVMEFAELPATIVFLMTAVLTVLFLVLYIPLIQLVWKSAKMLKGGLGWFFVILYWPLTAYWLQKRIKTLYPKAAA